MPNEYWLLENTGDILIYNINFNEDGEVINNENLNTLRRRINDIPEIRLPNIEDNNTPPPYGNRLKKSW